MWDPLHRRLYWLDLYQPTLHCHDPAKDSITSYPINDIGNLGSLVRTTAKDAVILGSRAGLVQFDLSSRQTRVIAQPLATLPHLVHNDAKVDSCGRLWLSTCDATETDPRAVLFRLDGDGVHVADAGFVVCNGPAFSPDGRTLYFSDSIGARILAYDVRDDGTLLNRQLFATFTSQDGLPDGLAVDQEGGLWVGHWAGSCVSRFKPDGSLDRRIPLPVPNVTACAFGGDDLGTLFITTAFEGMSDEQRDAAPHAGALFAVRPGIVGFADPAWSGSATP